VTKTLEVKKTDGVDGSGFSPRIMHIVKRDPTTGRVIEPKIALCGKRCEKELGGVVSGWIHCMICKDLATKMYGATPTR